MANAQIKWTQAQKSAIDARGGSVLVCAAAGSGKTAVLVERVIERLADRENPCDADTLLIVTFTRAAAQQMRERIAAALSLRLRENPSDPHLRRQQTLLPFAQISTIDSLCNTLVRNHFHALPIEPDFDLLDGSRETVMQRESLQAVVAQAYQADEPTLAELAALLSDTRDDGGLARTIQSLYTQAQSHPDPAAWLRALCTPYRSVQPFAQTPWCALFLQTLRELLRGCIASHEAQCAGMADYAVLMEKYRPVFEADLAMLRAQLDAAERGDWDALVESIAASSFVRMATVTDKQCPERHSFKNSRDATKTLYENTLKKLDLAPAAQHEAEREALRPLVELLVQLALDFDAHFSVQKREKNLADFSDVLHWTLALLVDENGAKTPLAMELAAQYSELLVDEYQDINRAQELLFWALSREESNLFMVGDVKQSIYRFRQADPELFLARQRDYAPHETGEYPAKIILGKNFRSRRGVTDAVNFVFRQIMHREGAEIEYNEGEMLIAGADYPENEGADTELHLLETDGGDAALLQAEHIAQEIRRMMDSGMMVQNGKTQRPLRPGDVCILMRSMSSARLFAKVLAQYGLPGHMAVRGGFFAMKEIHMMRALLQVLDNPIQDVPLLAVMLSPLFGFTAQELARLRIDCRDGSLYHALNNAAKNGDEKVIAFLDKLSFFRRLSATLPAGELLRRLYDETGFLSLVCAMRGGAGRQANLQLLLEYANDYHRYGSTGLSGFLRFLDALERSGGDLDAAGGAAQGLDAVSIMTIHKSKGLEFPVVFLANCSGQFNTLDERERVVLSPHAGLGMRLADTATYSYAKSAGLCAAVLDLHRVQCAEEMRLLYVAMTRAKEKLILLCTASNAEKALEKAAQRAGTAPAMDSLQITAANSFADWLLPAIIRHPDAHNFRMQLTGDVTVLPEPTGLRTILAQPQTDEIAEEETIPAQADAALLQSLRKKLDYEYPYRALDMIPAKQTASALAHEENQFDFFASATPAFLQKDHLSAAQRGTATHRFMQYADLRAAAENPQRECERLVQADILTAQEGEAVRIPAVRTFFASDLARRMFASSELMRERKFAVRIPAGELYPEAAAHLRAESIVVQGIADCVFREGGALVIVDYKTDRIQNAADLVERYRDQLLMYERALSECLGLPVKETLLYSFALGESIRVSDLPK